MLALSPRPGMLAMRSIVVGGSGSGVHVAAFVHKAGFHVPLLPSLPEVGGLHFQTRGC